MDWNSGTLAPILPENKTHKICSRCAKLKPITEFYADKYSNDGLQHLCKKCKQESRLRIKGKHYSGLHKRPFPLDGRCEICYTGLGGQFYDYHHWDDNDLNLGIWVCYACDYLAEGLDEIDKNFWKVDTYRRLKKEIEEAERTYIYLGPFSPPDGIYKLFLNNKQTHKWCPHCGQMKPIPEFNKGGSHEADLHAWCRECEQSARLKCWLNGQSVLFIGLHKRVRPDYCELCGDRAQLNYHHWDDNNKSKGVWVCGMNKNKCHHLVEAVDKLDNGSLLPNKYLSLRQEIIQAGLNNE